jgi:hypothetical protein
MFYYAGSNPSFGASWHLAMQHTDKPLWTEGRKERLPVRGGHLCALQPMVQRCDIVCLLSTEENCCSLFLLLLSFYLVSSSHTLSSFLVSRAGCISGYALDQTFTIRQWAGANMQKG